MSIQGKPVCYEWWRDPQLGLESRLYSYIKPTRVADRFNSGSADPEWKRKVVRGFLQNSPPDINASPSGVNQAPGNKNPLAPTTWLGEAGILLGYIMTKTAMYIVTSGLPMVQAIVLACVYIALPIAVPFATLRPGLLVFFISALFSLKFLTALWALSKFIDERMIGYMYDNTSNLVQLDSNDTVLSIITTLSYVGLPIVWLWLMSSFTGKGVEGVNLLFAYTAAKLDSAAQQPMSVAQSAVQSGVSKGVTAVSKGVERGDEVMPEVRPAVELLDGYGDVIDACRTLAQVGDRYWNSIYLPLIRSIADYFQLLTDRYGEHKLIEIALDDAHKSLELCIAADIKTRPKLTMFAAFSAALCQDVGQPAGDLEVTVTTTGGESTLWQPAEGDRLASLGEDIRTELDVAVSTCEKLVGCNCMESATASWQKVACQ